MIRALRKGNLLVLFRIKSIPACLLLVMLLSAFFLCCDEVERHRTLTFFFDGVPPLEPGETATPITSDLQNIQQTTPESPWYVHEPQKDCTTCHGRRRDRGFTRETLLVSPVPDLCYNCHTNYTTSAPYVHGPVAVGQCLFCHNPHKSKINHLLKEKEPDLCYLCHDVTLIQQIPSHAIIELSACTVCHDAHAGPTRAFLKDNSLQTNEITQIKPNNTVVQTYTPPAQNQDSNIPDKTPPVASENEDIIKVYQAVKKMIDLDEIQMARDYLERLKDSSAFTKEERQSIAQILKQLELVTIKKESESTPATTDDTDARIEKRAQEIADLYYRSLAFYHSDRLTEARDGFIKVLNSGLIPERMKKTINDYISKIDAALVQRAKSSNEN